MDQDLMQSLRTRLVSLGFSTDTTLRRMSTLGLAHDHFEVRGTGMLVRVPVQSQLGFDPSTHLRYEAACFERAAPSQHTPQLHAVMDPGKDLPRGGLLVDAIDGRPPRLPEDLPLLAHALAALHSVNVPAPSGRPPLKDPLDPLVDTFEEIKQRERFLTEENVHPRTIKMIDAALDEVRKLLTEPSRPPVRLISFDAHPGNFVIDRQERAVLVDLEKARYGPPSLDLAHATLYTSTTWDIRSSAVLEQHEVAAFYEAWREAVQPELASNSERWHVPLRRLMWLWSVTWSAEWRAENKRPGGSTSGGARLFQHVRDRVDDYLDPETVASIQEDWQERP